jgi:myosin heavy subunit
LVDLDESIRLQKISNENIRNTNELSLQLKKQLAENRKVYSGLMDKAERIVVEENQEYKKSIRENSKIKANEKVVKLVPADFKTMEKEQQDLDLQNMKLITKLDSLNRESNSELKLHISKATFYSKQARVFDDKLAKLKNQSYQNKAYASQSTSKTETVSKPLTLDEIKKELAKQPAKVKAVKIENVEGIKDINPGYYIVLGNFEDGGERDAFIKKLTDSGSLDANFFYNINILSYYVYSTMSVTKEEAQYLCVQKLGKPLYEKMFIANVVSDN